MWTTRRVRPGDLEALLQLQHRHQTAVLGRPDATLDDVRDQLADPDLEPSSAVVEQGGLLLGCALVFHDGGSDQVDVDVVVDPVRGHHLLTPLLTRALELASTAVAGRGHGQVLVDQGCYREDTRLASALADLGFAPATAFHRMRRELEADVVVHVPPGVVVERHDDEDVETLRRAYCLHTATFAGHFGFVARPFPEWLTAHRARSGTAPLWFATIDGVDAGFLQETGQFVRDENAGYVLRLGVQPWARARGVARVLLLSSFAAMRARGRRAALLHVDSANTTGATRLYESVGMRPVVVIDVWRCTRPVG